MRVNRLAIATCSLGLHPSHTLPLKIQSAASAGFAGIELFYSDLQQYAQDSAKSLLDAALQVKELCSKEGITIVTFGPMTNFEGCLSPLSSRLKVASEWIAIARVLETTVIRIPSATDENASGDEDLIITELRALCALGAEGGNPISFAYESLSYGTYAALWEDSLRLAQLVDRPNFGLCLDTFHVCARVWANPQASSGKIPGGTAALGASLKRFVKECPMDKVFIVQLSDAERMDPPILPGHAAYEEGKDAVACWSGYGRLFPLEEEKGTYLPVVDVAKTWLVDKAWGGWISLEVFHREMKEQSMGPGVLARRGMQSWERLRKSIGLEM